MLLTFWTRSSKPTGMVCMFRFFQKIPWDGELGRSVFLNAIHGIPTMEFNIYLYHHEGNYAVYIYVTRYVTF